MLFEEIYKTPSKYSSQEINENKYFLNHLDVIFHKSYYNIINENMSLNEEQNIAKPFIPKLKEIADEVILNSKYLYGNTKVYSGYQFEFIKDINGDTNYRLEEKPESYEHKNWFRLYFIYSIDVDFKTSNVLFGTYREGENIYPSVDSEEVIKNKILYFDNIKNNNINIIVNCFIIYKETEVNVMSSLQHEFIHILQSISNKYKNVLTTKTHRLGYFNTYSSVKDADKLANSYLYYFNKFEQSAFLNATYVRILNLSDDELKIADAKYKTNQKEMISYLIEVSVLQNKFPLVKFVLDKITETKYSNEDDVNVIILMSYYISLAHQQFIKSSYTNKAFLDDYFGNTKKISLKEFRYLKESVRKYLQHNADNYSKLLYSKVIDAYYEL